ncbi:MAG: PHP-associated domain-containing protein [Candidatus Aenigmatarchaeota archaeon]
MIRVDLHSHVGIIEYKWKGRDVEIYKGDLLKTALQHLKEGNHAVAITTENAKKSYKMIKYLESVLRKYPIPIDFFPAEEIYTEDGELVIVYPQDVEPESIEHTEKHVYDSSFMERVDNAKEHGAIVFLPHPFNHLISFIDNETNLCMGWSLFDEKLNLREKYKDFFSRVDAIEVLNGSFSLFYHYPKFRRISISPIKKAFLVCRKYGLPMLGNSDSHSPEFVGTAYSLTGDDPIKSIKRGFVYPQLNTRKLTPKLFFSQLLSHYKNKEISKLPRALKQNLLKSLYL